MKMKAVVSHAIDRLRNRGPGRTRRACEGASALASGFLGWAQDERWEIEEGKVYCILHAINVGYRFPRRRTSHAALGHDLCADEDLDAG